ncbi:MAG: FecR domain-containing protein [Thiobacillaceae bacterium]
MRIPLLLAALIALPAQAADWLYLTYPGDTLSQIARTYLKNMRDWPKVQAVNRVSIPERLPVNTRIKIPVELLKVTPASVTVTAVSGNVRYKSGDGPFQPLASGTQLHGGENVLTGPRSSATYRFADGSVLTQQAFSNLSFGRLAAYGKTGMVSTDLSLGSGRLEAHASKQLPPAGGFGVRTAVAVAGLRGTDFRLNLGEDGKSLRNEVLEGTVNVAAQGRDVSVEAGYGTVVEAGKPPEAPRSLLMPPAATGLDALIERLPLSFTWQPVAGASAYRAQVARDAAFSEVLLDDVTPQASITWQDDLPDGNYVLRIRAIDSAGLEGGNRDHAFELDARPLPPALLSPMPGERRYENEVELSWAAAAEAHGYVLQVAPTPEFDNGLIERRLAPVTRHVETLPEGDWHWRIASVDEAGKQHVWSQHRAFRVQPLPNPPVAHARADAGQAQFAWGQSKGAARYALQVGESADLSVAQVKMDTAATNLSVPLKSGKYYWRVRSVEGDGQSGAWSAVSPVIVPPDAPSGLAVQVNGNQLLATWKGDAPAYKLELSTDTSFAKPLLSQLVHEANATLPKPNPGDYWLRVTGVGAEAVEGPASQALAVQVKPPRPWWLLLFPFLMNL